ncbi:hypothetical protein [Bdellovibrio svalbardensis]|uniref:EF-hand domain-containing protein n=1 Tax=Bdellovibrio svalbardensis TaxID=2972972 RepID=A0ABT6DK03_9BACT|nr:hypothetical protein [Bdellovibrio svalbardensis]MDG0816181.1 hypothetical protein [Bdellovibrio svalbardensis]
MLFKKTLQFVLVGISALSLTACTDFINGQKTEPEVLNFSNDRLSCLKQLPTHLKDFSIGEAKEKDIRGSFDCARDALLYFKNKTYGSVPNAYTVDEVRNFFAKYFLKENNVSPEFSAELMKIKKALLGGSESYITKDEIVRLVDLLAIVRDEAVQLSPHMKVLLNQAKDKGTNWDQVSAATEQLRFSFQRLLEKTQISGSDYGFEDAKRALSGLGEFLRGSEPFAPYEKAKEWVPLVESVKNILVGRRAQMSKLYQWKEGLDTVIDLYGLALKYRYVIQNLDFGNANDIHQLSQFIGQGLDLIENCQQMKSAGVIPAEDLDQLIEQLTPYFKFSFKLRESSLKKIYRIVLLRMLSPDRKGDSRGFAGLEKAHIAALRREFNIWRMDQSFIDLAKMDEKSQTISQKDLLERYNDFNKSFVIEKGITSNPLEQMALDQSWDDFGQILKSPILVNYNEKGRIIEATNPSSYGVTWKSLTKTNLMRGIARMLMLGYGENTAGKLSDARMSKAGLIAWYEEFNEIGLDIKAFDPRSGNSGSRSFLEANFFTFSGNGDQWMDQRETFEFVSLLFSAGLSSSDDIRKGMIACEVSQKDIFGYAYLKESCFKKQFRTNFSFYFDNMPWMGKFVKGLNDKDYDEFYNYLKSSAVMPDQKVGLIETANIRTMVTILHYVESIMITYDLDRNQTLSLDEVYAAAPRFMSFFKTVSPTQYEFIIEEGFAYLVFKGSMPGLGGLTGFQVTKHFVDEATRKDILRLFGTLKEQLNKVPN